MEPRNFGLAIPSKNICFNLSSLICYLISGSVGEDVILFSQTKVCLLFLDFLICWPGCFFHDCLISGLLLLGICCSHIIDIRNSRNHTSLDSSFKLVKALFV
jgi:hypothetical protein